MSEISPNDIINKAVFRSIQYGFVRQEIPQIPQNQNEQWHFWTLFISGINQELSNFVEKAVFYIHQSFDNNVRSVSKPPYEITVFGISSFTAYAQLVFKDASIQPQTYPIEIEIKSDKSFSMGLKRDVIMFCKIRRWFYDLLSIQQQQKCVSGISHFFAENYDKFDQRNAENIYLGTETSVFISQNKIYLEETDRLKSKQKEDLQIVNSIIEDERRTLQQ